MGYLPDIPRILTSAGCLQAPNNWPRKLAHATGRHVDDWSFTAQTSGSLVGRVDHAIRSGAVHNDSTVVISIGLNDFGGFGAVDNQNLALFDPPAVARDFTANMRTVADRIRSHAPDAHIVMTGSLPTVDRANTTFCALNVVPDFPLGAPVPVLRDVENWNRDNQRSAAAEMGADFVEIMTPVPPTRPGMSQGSSTPPPRTTTWPSTPRTQAHSTWRTPSPVASDPGSGPSPHVA